MPLRCWTAARSAMAHRGAMAARSCTGYSPGMSKLERLLGRRDARDLLRHCRGRKGPAAAAHRRLRDRLRSCGRASRLRPETGSSRGAGPRTGRARILRYTTRRACSMRPRFMPGSPTPLYQGGLLDRGGGHFHSLNYVIGLGRALLKAGGRVHEHSPVLAIEPGARTILRSAQRRCFGRCTSSSPAMPISEGCCRQSRRASCRLRAMSSRRRRWARSPLRHR